MFQSYSILSPFLFVTAVGTFLNCGMRLSGPEYTVAPKRFDWIVAVQMLLVLFCVFLTGLLAADRNRVNGGIRRFMAVLKTTLISLPLMIVSVFLVMIPCILVGGCMSYILDTTHPLRPEVPATLLLAVSLIFGLKAWGSYTAHSGGNVVN